MTESLAGIGQQGCRRHPIIPLVQATDFLPQTLHGDQISAAWVAEGMPNPSPARMLIRAGFRSEEVNQLGGRNAERTSESGLLARRRGDLSGLPSIDRRPIGSQANSGGKLLLSHPHRAALPRKTYPFARHIPAPPIDRCNPMILVGFSQFKSHLGGTPIHI
ncbi:hypothetical protein GCM10027597_18810 [Saccharopolyspora tripterygii]